MILGEKRINKISGPVSIFMLKPNKDFFKSVKQENNHIPIMLLFGDTHFSNSDQCPDCKCDEDSESCCYHVYSTNFLQLLNKYSTKEHCIDFYMEFYLQSELKKSGLLSKSNDDKIEYFEKRRNEKSITPMKLLREHILACYYTELDVNSDLFKKYCPASNINWKYADLRQSVEDITKYAKSVYEFLCYHIFTLYDETEENNSFYDNYTTDIYSMYNKLISEDELSILFETISSLLKSPTDFINIFFKTKNSLYVNRSILYTSIKQQSEYVKENLLYNICFEFISSYFQITSKLYKTEMAYLSLFFHYASLCKTKSELDILIHQNNLSNSFPEQDIVEDIGLNLTIFFLDLYYIFDSFNSTKTFLSIGYFGSKHQNIIRDVLVNKLHLYEDVSENSSSNSIKKRCQDLSCINWDLVEIAKEYNGEF